MSSKVSTSRLILLNCLIYSRYTPNLTFYSRERQEQLDLLTGDISATEIDKVFIEREPENQTKYDSLYMLYLRSELTDTTVLRPEEIQIGFRVAQQSGLRRVICSDYKQELPYDEIARFDSVHAEKTFPSFYDRPYPFSQADRRPDLTRQTLSEYYLTLNDTYNKQRRYYDYLHYAMMSVDGQDYSGPELTEVWYGRNLKIFANILNSLTGDEQTILVLYGASHTDILHDLFKHHPAFKVVELDNILSR